MIALLAPLCSLGATTAVSLAAAQAPAPPPVTGGAVAAMLHAGPIGWLLVLVSVVALAIVLENLATLRRAKLAPPALALELESLFDEQCFREALELCERERTYLTSVVAAGLGHLGHPFETIQTSLREVESEESVKLFQKIGRLGLIARTAPALGLLGTLTGIYLMCDAIAVARAPVDSAQIATDLKAALVTTIFGLCVAIPVGAFSFWLRRRMVRTLLEVNALAEDLFDRFRTRSAAH